MKKWFIVFLFVLFVPIIVNAEDCKSDDYACIKCEYYIEKYDTSITYTISSDGEKLTISRDKDSWKYKAGFFSVTTKYSIDNDALTSSNFVTTSSNGNKKLTCLNQIYYHLNNMAYSIDITYKQNNSYTAIQGKETFNNGKNIYSETNESAKSCSYTVYNASWGMGYKTDGIVDITFNDSKILSVSFSNNANSVSQSTDYSSILDILKNNCASLQVVCTKNSCTISKDGGIEGYNYSGDKTEDASSLNNTNKTTTKASTKKTINTKLQACKNTNVLKAFKIIGSIIIIVKIVAPIILILTGMISLFKAIMEDETSAIKKSLTVLLQKFIIAAFIFFIPSIMDAVFSLVEGYDTTSTKFSACMQCMNNIKKCK